MTSELFPELSERAVQRILRGGQFGTERIDRSVVERMVELELVSVKEHRYVRCAYEADYDFLSRERLDCQGRVEVEEGEDTPSDCPECGQPLGDVERKRKFLEYEFKHNLEGIKRYLAQALKSLGVVKGTNVRRARAHFEAVLPDGQTVTVYLRDYVDVSQAAGPAVFVVVSPVSGPLGPDRQSLGLAEFLSKPSDKVRGSWRRVVLPLLAKQKTGALLDLISDHFSRQELRELCYELSVEYDDLPGEGRRAKALELVRFLERRGRLPELVDRIRQERPGVDVAGILEAG